MNRMVFGFGKKRIENIPTTQKDRRVSLEEIPKIIQEMELPKITEVVNNAKTIKEEIEVDRKKILNLILQLESDDLKLDDIDRNLRIIVKRGKDSVVSTIKKETSSSMTNVTKYEHVILLNSEINQMLKRIGDVLGLNTRVIHIFAKKYATSLKDEITKMTNNRNRLQSEISFVENFKDNGKMITDLIGKIKEQRNEILQRNERITEINYELEVLKDKIKSLEKHIHDLKSSTGHSKFLELKRKIDSIQSEKNAIKNIINLQFSKISRPLGKYSYISSFEKPIKKMMDELISNPYEVISFENKKIIIQILEAVAKSVLSGSISVKDTDRALEQIQETITRLDEFIGIKESYSNKISTLENDLVVFDHKFLESQEHDLKKKKNDYANLEITKKKIESEIDNANNLLTKHVSEIESSLSAITNSKVILA
jgi:DNA repair exonuclease SbcCD ATPase subunit